MKNNKIGPQSPYYKRHKLSGYHIIKKNTLYGDVRFDENEYKLPIHKLKFKGSIIV